MNASQLRRMLTNKYAKGSLAFHPGRATMSRLRTLDINTYNVMFVPISIWKPSQESIPRAASLSKGRAAMSCSCKFRYPSANEPEKHNSNGMTNRWFM